MYRDKKQIYSITKYYTLMETIFQQAAAPGAKSGISSPPLPQQHTRTRDGSFRSCIVHQILLINIINKRLKHRLTISPKILILKKERNENIYRK